MATPMNYDSLINQLTLYLDRNDASTLQMLPYFIYQAEQRICRESKSLLLELYVSGNFAIGQSVYLKPATWRRTLSWNWGNGTGDNVHNQLFLRSYEFCRNYWPDPTLTGNPEYYADYGYTGFLVVPTPAISSPFELAYLGLPDPITPINQTNFLCDFCPDLLLYACLLESTPYIKVDERLPVWQSMYDRALASLNTQDDERLLDRSSNRGAD